MTFPLPAAPQALRRKTEVLDVVVRLREDLAVLSEQLEDACNQTIGQKGYMDLLNAKTHADSAWRGLGYAEEQLRK